MGANTLTISKALDVKAEFANHAPSAKTLNTQVNRHKNEGAKLTLPKVASTPSKAPAKRVSAADVSEWNSLGNVSYTDPCIPDWFSGVEPITVNCEIQEAGNYPGYFRLVNPYMEFPELFGVGSYSGSASDPKYMYINATNPDAVYIEYFDTGYYLGEYGQLSMWSYGDYFLSRGYDLATIANAGYCGTYANGLITFPSETLLSSLENYEDGSLYIIGNAYFCVAMPGAKDYSISVSADGCAKDNIIPWTVYYGNDVATATYFLIDGEWEASAEIIQEAAEIALEMGYSLPSSGSYSFNLDGADPGRYTLFVGAFDEDGNFQGGECTFFYVMYDNDDEWQKVADVNYGDVFIGSQYKIGYTEFEVELQENIQTPGYYRIVNPYSGNFSGAGNSSHNSDHNHYIYINATNPEAVVLEEGPIGSNWGYGDMVVSSKAFRDGTDFGSISSYDDYNKCITFPSGSLLFAEQGYQHGEWIPCESEDGGFFLEIPKLVIADQDIIDPSEISINKSIALPSASVIDTDIVYSLENAIAEVEGDIVAELVSDPESGAVSLLIHKAGEFDLVAKIAGNDDYAPKRLVQHIVVENASDVIGDIDGDGTISVSDVVMLCNYVLSNEYVEIADLDNSGDVSVSDVVILVNMILIVEY